MRHGAKSPPARRADAAHSHPAPIFRALTPRESEQLLARNHVARLAFSFHDRIDIEPVHYVYEDGWMFGRTSPGSKLATIMHNHWVAAEVDEIRSLFDWRSVVVHGAFYTVEPDVPGVEAAALARGIELLRTIVPETGTPDDPVPFRSIIFRIHCEETTGREATPGSR